MRYLVTGGAGFIGSHLSEALADAGHDVVALDDLSTGSLGNTAGLEGRERFRLVSGDVTDDGTVGDLVAASDVVVHLAAAVGVKLVVDHPLQSLRTNLRGTEVVLEAADRHSKTVFIASTSEVYGKNSGRMHELADRVLGPCTVARWSYAASKAIDEHLAFAYARERGLRVIVARFFNTVGPRQMGIYGMVLTRFVAQALIGDEVTVYGDGTQTRCFCDVEDTVRAVVGLLDEPRAIGDVFNIGSEEEVTIRELAERVIAATGSKAAIRFITYGEVFGDQYEDMLRRVPDTAKIRGLLGWAPRHDLDAIIKRQIAFATEVGPETLLDTRGR